MEQPLETGRCGDGVFRRGAASVKLLLLLCSDLPLVDVVSPFPIGEPTTPRS